MIYPILIAHERDPDNFKHQMTIEFIGKGNFDDIAQEIVDLLNENEVRDCIYKLKDIQ